jgi:hypothetical protein
MYRKNQVRVEATILITWHGFLFSDQNMYVRRFTPFGDFNRYRKRTYVSHSVAIERYKMTPFAFYEVYYDFQGALAAPRLVCRNRGHAHYKASHLSTFLHSAG